MTSSTTRMKTSRPRHTLSTTQSLTFEAPKAKVKEAFGEIRIPIIKDVPGLQEFEISGAARVSDYSLGTTGTVWAYSGSAVWAPIKGLRFRGNYARSVRAPNQVELFTPFGQNFSLVNDPCDVNQVGAGSDNRAANCVAAGIPAGTSITYSSSLPFLSGGNENLEAEKSDSITIGGVFTPTFLVRFLHFRPTITISRSRARFHSSRRKRS